MRKSEPVQDWMIGLLDVQPDDRVLDVGCGPGVALALAARRAPQGHVVGIDASPVMVAQARRRNQAMVAQGRIEAREGTAASLPFPDASFSKLCTANSVPFWPSITDGLAELRRIAAPGGRIVVAVRMHRESVGPANPSAYGFTDERLEALTKSVDHVGFWSPGIERHEWPRETIAAVVART